jgi:6-phosphofructokinase 2
MGGFTGRRLRQLLERESIEQVPIPIEEENRENITIRDISGKRQFRFVMQGAALREDEWKKVIKNLYAILPKPDFIVASGSLPPGVPKDFYARLGRVAGAHSAKLIVDTSGEALHTAARAGTYMLKPNLREFGELAGIRADNESLQEELAMDIVESGQAEVLVLSLGREGVLLATRDGYERFRPPDVRVDSKVGAGDSMVAGIVLSLAQGKPLKEAVCFGLAAGSAAVITPGSELCRFKDTAQLYESISHSVCI